MRLRTLARTCVALFAVSAAFPVGAGAANQQRPLGWLGVVDVAFAAALVGAAAVLVARTRGAVADRHRLAAFRATQGVAGLIPALLAAYFVARPRVNWPVLVIGLAWRAWLLVATLPSLAAALAPAGPRHAGPGYTGAGGRRPADA
ncbi:hypothetical protein tb265_45870 [Gemmatimonadetes bacterium T265]|nr:hypothetical protein tb265_45870 [Gemmatimonadetes bacterium T265]